MTINHGNAQHKAVRTDPVFRPRVVLVHKKKRLEEVHKKELLEELKEMEEHEPTK